MKVRAEVLCRIFEFQAELLLIKPTEERAKLLGHSWGTVRGEEQAGAPLPRYYRLLAYHDNEFATLLQSLLGCELELPSESHDKAGSYDDPFHFYYARLRDEDLPVGFS